MDPVDKFVVVLTKWATALTVGQFAAVTVGPRAAIIFLLFLMAVDWISGFTAAWLRGEVESEAGARGLAKKGLTLLLILTVHVGEKLAGWEFNLEAWGAAGYCINEACSILENMDRAGVKIYKPIVQGLKKVKGLGPGEASKSEIDELRDPPPPGN